LVVILSFNPTVATDVKMIKRQEPYRQYVTWKRERSEFPKCRVDIPLVEY
jgi:hypothetical protein